MAANTRKEAAKKFAAYWFERRGSEKGEDQTFWNSLLSEVLGVSDVKSRIRYQDPVHYKGTTKFLDAWIPETQVLIEHKSRGVDLDAPQAHHDGQTPFQQAWDYDNNRPRREKARWIVVTNFDEIRIHDMEGVLTSSVHMAWMRTVCGRLEMRYRYSAAIVYDNFPWPGGVGAECRTPRANFEAEIEKTAQGILDARALYPDSSLADLYDPLTMPPELRKAHAANDAVVLKAC